MTRTSLATCIIAAFVAFGLFFLYAYNSGYGYDALEYLVIGRELSRGSSLYDFAPSKGPGIYYFVAALCEAIGPVDRTSLAVVVTTIAATVVAVAVYVAGGFATRRAALFVAVVVLLSAMAMEQNFLETEGFVLLSGLVALRFLLSSDRLLAAPLRAFAAGATLGIGALFKAVAFAYAPPLALGILVFARCAVRERIIGVVALALGALAPIVLAAACFGFAGHLEPFWQWSLTYPLFEYPGDSEFARKTLVKCSWLIVLVLGSVVHVALRPGGWRTVMRDPVFATTVTMALFAMIPLLKSQASHYVFPAAGCVALAMARAITIVPPGNASRQLGIVFGSIGLAALVALAFVRPDAWRRFHQWQDFSVDERVVRTMHRVDPTAGPLLALDRGAYLLQVSGRAPLPGVLVNTHVQPARYFREHPDELRLALANPALRLVAWDPDRWRADHGTFPLQANDDLRAAFRAQLESGFERVDSVDTNLVLWRRR